MLFNFLNKKINDVQAEDEMAMGCCCDPCTTPPVGSCLPTVTIPVTTVIRGTAIPGPIIIFIENQNCLKCVREKCYIQNINIDNPCPNCPDLVCQVCVDRLRYVGCVNFSANIPIQTPTPTPTPVAFYTCYRDCLCIDSVRCYTCANCDSITCPPNGVFITNVTAALAGAPILLPGGFSQITINITLTLTNPCPGCTAGV